MFSKEDPAALRSVIEAMRAEITSIGPNDAMPLFDRETKQR